MMTLCASNVYYNVEHELPRVVHAADDRCDDCHHVGNRG